MKLNIYMVVTLLNQYFIGLNILYLYDDINQDLLLCNYNTQEFKFINIKRLKKDFYYYILSSNHNKNKALETLNKISFF